MAYEFYLRHLNRNGAVKRQAITDFLSLKYRKPVNDTGRLEIEFDENHSVVGNLQDFDLFEVYWRNLALGVDWHKDFEAIWRNADYETGRDDLTQLKLVCPGQAEILKFRTVAYPPGTINRSAFSDVPAETAMKNIVRYNCTAEATAGAGRVRDGDLLPGMGFEIVVADDLGRGEKVTRSLSGQKVLGALRDKLAPVAGGDWSFKRVPSDRREARWVFDFHVGQLGNDLTEGGGRVIFSLGHGNMARPSLKVEQRQEATIIIARGQGAGQSVYYAVIEGDAYQPSNDIELEYDASGEVEAAGVQTAGEEAAAKHRAKYAFAFDVVQTEHVFYSTQYVKGKKTYKVGDMVLARYAGYELVRQITAVTVSVDRRSNEDPVQIAVEVDQRAS